MLQNNGFSEELLNAYGWEKIISKNPVMVSFSKDELRLNYYFTTGTVTIQDNHGKLKTYREIHENEQIEEILCKKNLLN